MNRCSIFALVLFSFVNTFAQSARYSFIGEPVDGLYGVMSNDGPQMGVIDVTGREVVPVKYDYVTVVNDSTIIVSINDKAGVIDSDDNIVIPLVCNSLNNCKDGHFIADNRIIDRMGNVVYTPPVGERIYDCDHNYVLFGNDNYNYGLKTMDGRVVVKPDYDYIQFPADGLVPVMKENKLGFADLEGKIVIPMIYDYYNEDENGISEYGFNEGLAAVSKNDMYGYIDVDGNIAIPFNFTWTEPFKNGKAIVEKFGKRYKIDKTGKKLAESSAYSDNDLKEGIAMFVDQKTWRYGYKDPNTGRVLIPAKYIVASPFVDGYALVRIGDSICLIDKTGKVVLKNIASFSYFDAA